MGKTQTQAKERRKALAGRKQYVQEPLSDLEIISDCKARIRMCEGDMRKQGDNQVIKRKIQGFKDTIADIELKLEREKALEDSNQNNEKEVKTNDN